MDTVITQFTNENQEVKRLFRQLFQFQILLNDNIDSNFQDDFDVKNTMESIDRLMILLIRMYEVEKNE